MGKLTGLAGCSEGDSLACNGSGELRRSKNMEARGRIGSKFVAKNTTKDKTTIANSSGDLSKTIMIMTTTSQLAKKTIACRRGVKGVHFSSLVRQQSEFPLILRLLRLGLAIAATSLLLLLLLLCGLNSLQTEAIRLQPEGREKFYWSGEQFVITCQNNNNIKNVKIRWIGPNGLDITEDRSQRVHAESAGPHGHRLVVMNATVSADDGQYKCTLGSTDDRNPREHTEFNLKLYKATSFRDTPTHLILPAGQQGTLNCRVEFDPSVSTASVSWVRDQRPIDMFNDSAYTVLDYDPNRQLSQLIVSPVTKHHDGVYTCRAVAETAQLSKISDHNIRLETNYAPTFDSATHTVWVERSQSLLNRLQQQHLQPQANLYGQANRHRHGLGSSSGSGSNNNNNNNNKQFQPNGALMATMLQGNMYGRRRPGQEAAEASSDEARATDGGQVNGTNQLVRVELHCTCQANPPATIRWISTENSRYVLAKGDPAHVLEEPSSESDGHNTSSVLVIGYNLDVNWAHRRDKYVCSASNKLGQASKTFTIEQGDPPPAFNVGPLKHYDPLTYLFKFTLMGPNFDPESQTNSPEQMDQSLEIVPAVDSFRIRAENPLSQTQAWTSKATKRQNEHSVQWSILPVQAGRQQQSLSVLKSPMPEQIQLNKPQNFTVKLGQLPSGNQKLFLEAHNAVGWSPNATYLGDYYIVSGASSATIPSSTSNQLWANLVLGLIIGGSACFSASWPLKTKPRFQ